MPIECTLLRDKPSPFVSCPKCGAFPFDPFLRGQVQSFWRRWLHMAYCCVICRGCKEIVGYEKP